MTQALRDLPPAPAVPTDELLDDVGHLARSDVATIRARLAETLQRVDARLAAYAHTVSGIVSDVRGLLESGAAVDVEGMIDGLLRDEKGALRSKSEAERRAGVQLRKLAAVDPNKLAVANEILRETLARADRAAALHRDARWELMKARALHQPSAPKGAIHGEPWDADEYLKTLG